jgi:hypothetical protein
VDFSGSTTLTDKVAHSASQKIRVKGPLTVNVPKTTDNLSKLFDMEEFPEETTTEQEPEQPAPKRQKSKKESKSEKKDLPEKKPKAKASKTKQDTEEEEAVLLDLSATKKPTTVSKEILLEDDAITPSYNSIASAFAETPDEENPWMTKAEKDTVERITGKQDAKSKRSEDTVRLDMDKAIILSTKSLKRKPNSFNVMESATDEQKEGLKKMFKESDLLKQEFQKERDEALGLNKMEEEEVRNSIQLFRKLRLYCRYLL